MELDLEQGLSNTQFVGLVSQGSTQQSQEVGFRASIQPTQVIKFAILIVLGLRVLSEAGQTEVWR